MKKKKKGLTLLELVIVLALMGLVTMLVFSFTNLTQKKSKELEIRQELQHEGTMITESFMKNVLQARGISGIKLSSNGSMNINSIDFMIVEDTAAKKTQVARYKLNLKELKLSEVITENVGVATPNVTENKKGIVTTNIKSIEILSEDIRKIITDNSGVSEINKDMLKNVKNINLKIILEEEYYNKTIEHEHIMELNLRNAN